MEIREELVDEVRKYFVGPRSGDDETLQNDDPLNTYTTGILFPTSTPQDELDKDDDKDSADDGDHSEIQNNDDESEKFLKQNSIGLRVDVKEDSKKIQINVNYARYVKNADGEWERKELDKKERMQSIDLNGPDHGEKIIFDDAGNEESKILWYIHRGQKKTHLPLNLRGFNTLNVFLENSKPWAVADDKSGAKDAKSGGKSEKKDAIDGTRAWMLNNENSIFQPSIELRGTAGENPFNAVSATPKRYTAAEDDLFDMLYRSKKVYGTGYGCAAEWESNDNPAFVKTAIIPTYEEDEVEKSGEGLSGKTTGQNDRPKHIDVYDLSCFEDKHLDDYETDRKMITKKLSPMIEQYRKWITSQEKIIDDKLGGDPYQNLARENMKKCRHVLKRMDDGLKLLTEEKGNDADRILKAFILANRAVLYQHVHFKYALDTFKGKKKSTGENLDWPNKKEPKQMYWYPFQIAFLLMSLRGIAYKQHDDNSDADLIWFPTGGGKTEAYLGAAAFAMVLRRLRGEVEDGLGVSVIMRYTLRLLTLQQFERASTLICALESLRMEKNSGLGSEPFLLGLWVGYSLTPNRYDDSQKAIADLKEDMYALTPNGSPWQTNYCPWCGNKVTPYNYRFDNKTKWTLLRCTNETKPCIFTDRNFTHGKILPLVTVDSDVYTRCPSMIIATVDKFARLPFRPETANIFGRARRRCELHGFLPQVHYVSCNIKGAGTHTKTPGKPKVHFIDSIFPPDLIIQDELHEISGPLGTMVGLYETAVDFLTTTTKDGKSVRPKVIASTATIKAAQVQVSKIFNRSKTVIFPPPGIDGKDSFFSWETGNKGKMFVGVSFSQKSGKFALGKLYAALLQRMQNIRLSKRRSDEEIDPYWTLVGYYNSTRELGGANRLVEDDVVKNIDTLADAIYDKPDSARDPGSPERGIDELTARKTQREINVIRDKLERTLYNSPDDVISILLATKMISIGIDIPRLSLMAINGQPKTATEYIQVTGRIGRDKKAPGIVFVLFNPYKPRDLSHYQNFDGFHRTMQKHVEPLSLTPFSIPAYTRGLHAVLIAMIRLTDKYMSGKKDADKFEMKFGKDATEFILSRFKSVEKVNEDSTSYKDFKIKLMTLQEQWEKFIKDTDDDPDLHEDVWYNNPYDPYHGEETKNPSVLMIEFAQHGEQKSDSYPLRTPESLRDVEQQLKMRYV